MIIRSSRGWEGERKVGTGMVSMYNTSDMAIDERGYISRVETGGSFK